MKENKIDNKGHDLYFGGHLVAFIDILGQSDRLEKIKDTRWWEIQEPTRVALRETYGRVRKFRKTFSSFLTSFVKTSPFDEAFRYILGGEELRIWDQFGPNRIMTKGLSDSFILNFPLIASNELLPLKSVYGVFGACASSMLYSLNYGFAVRGAIEIGPCIFDSTTDEVYGTALSDAVKYEKQANWPRILIGPNLIAYLKKCLELSHETIINQVNTSDAELCLKIVSRDKVGLNFLDYLAPDLLVLFKPENKDKIIEGAVTFIKRQIIEHKERPIIKYKYEMLRAYFIERNIGDF
jgi:hypothetical protein